MNILIKNAVIVTMDAGRVIKNGWLLVGDSKIEAIGEAAVPLAVQSGCKEVIDAGANIIMPGLINAHTHSAMTLFRGYAGGKALSEWLEKYIFPVEDRLEYNDCYWGNQLAACEMLASGTTCCADMYFKSESLAETILQSGMRANISRCGQWFGEEQDDFSADPRLKEQISLYDAYHNAGDGRIKVDIAVHSVYLSTPRYLQTAYALACERGLRFHIHLSETMKENEECAARFGKSPAAYLHDIGVLSQNTIAAHCVHLSEQDMALMAAAGATAVHNPASNLKLASGIAKTWEMHRRGVNVALGTDGVSSNNNLDMFAQMYLAALVACGVSLDAQATDAQSVLEMATVNGAIATGRANRTGMLKAGLAADLIMVDTHAPNMVPMHAAADNLVYAAHGANVRLTMVDGKILYRDGEFLTLDYEKITGEMAKTVGRLF